VLLILNRQKIPRHTKLVGPMNTPLAFLFYRDRLIFLVKFQEDVMQHFLKLARSFFAKSSQRFAEIIYVPSPTGSHDVGDQYLGDAASTYVEHKDFPDAARLPFRGVVLSKRK